VGVVTGTHPIGKRLVEGGKWIRQEEIRRQAAESFATRAQKELLRAIVAHQVPELARGNLSGVELVGKRRAGIKRRRKINPFQYR
jgi:hypothetical protein